MRCRGSITTRFLKVILTHNYHVERGLYFVARYGVILGSLFHCMECRSKVLKQRKRSFLWRFIKSNGACHTRFRTIQGLMLLFWSVTIGPARLRLVAFQLKHHQTGQLKAAMRTLHPRTQYMTNRQRDHVLKKCRGRIASAQCVRRILSRVFLWALPVVLGARLGRTTTKYLPKIIPCFVTDRPEL